MRTPVCLTYPWVFGDSLIAHLQSRQFDPRSYRLQDSKKVNRGRIKQNKIQVVAHDGELSHASASIIDGGDPRTITIYKRFETATLFRLRKKMTKDWRVRSGIGHFRNHMIKLVTIPCRSVTFHMRANVTELEKIIQGLPSIGKKSSIGFGAISDYNVETERKNYAIIKDGIAMRPIPVRLLNHYDDAAWMNHKAPYWSNDPELCAPPGAKIELKRPQSI